MSHKDESALITEIKIQDECVNITYPQVRLKNKTVQDKINEVIKEEVYKQIPPEGCEAYGEIFAKYEVPSNKKAVLSINLQFYTIRKLAANGINRQKSINVDLETGKFYELYEQFKPGSNYKIFLNKMIKEQIKEQDLHLIKEFVSITDDEDYYLTKNSLVIYFQELEYTIHAEGIPEFVIPYRIIRNLISDDSLIARFI